MLVDADDAANGFQLVPTLKVTGDATAFGFGTTSATVEIRDGGTDWPSGCKCDLGRLPNQEPSQSMVCQTLPLRPRLQLVASCTTTLGENDAITGAVDANAFTVPTNLDFPVSVPPV